MGLILICFPCTIILVKRFGKFTKYFGTVIVNIHILTIFLENNLIFKESSYSDLFHGAFLNEQKFRKETCFFKSLFIKTTFKYENDEP